MLFLKLGGRTKDVPEGLLSDGYTYGAGGTGLNNMSLRKF